MKTVREMFVSLTAMLINHIWASIIEICVEKWRTQSLKKIEIQMSRHEKRYRSEEIAPTIVFGCQVVTTLKNTAKPVTDLSFPAITICGSGLHMDRVGNKVAEKFVEWRTDKNKDNVTKEDLEEDLKDYMHAIFQIKSQYYYSESCWKLSDTILAINSYKKVLELGNSVFFEPSLIRLCRHAYENGDMISSNKYYQNLDTIASTNGLKREAIIRLMFGFEFGKHSLHVNLS